MLCYIIDKHDEDLLLTGIRQEINKFVCIGSVKDVNEARYIANLLPCLTEIRVKGLINKCCYIVCNP